MNFTYFHLIKFDPCIFSLVGALSTCSSSQENSVTMCVHFEESFHLILLAAKDLLGAGWSRRCKTWQVHCLDMSQASCSTNFPAFFLSTSTAKEHSCSFTSIKAKYIHAQLEDGTCIVVQLIVWFCPSCSRIRNTLLSLCRKQQVISNTPSAMHSRVLDLARALQLTGERLEGPGLGQSALWTTLPRQGAMC